MGLLSWISGYDESGAAKAAAADVERKRLAQIDVERGYLNPEVYAQYQRDYETDAFLDSIAAQNVIEESFDEGWQEGRQNVSNAISGTLNRIIADPLRAIIGGLPWWLWLAAGLAVFGYFGGFRWLKKQLA